MKGAWTACHVSAIIRRAGCRACHKELPLTKELLAKLGCCHSDAGPQGCERKQAALEPTLSLHVIPKFDSGVRPARRGYEGFCWLRPLLS